MSGSEEEIARQIVRDVAELPDRTSPADAPEMMLVTADELTGIVLDALLSQSHTAKERAWEEALRVVDDFKPPQPSASEFAKGADFAARQIWAAIRSLISSPRSEATSTPND